MSLFHYQQTFPFLDTRKALQDSLKPKRVRFELPQNKSLSRYVSSTQYDTGARRRMHFIQRDRARRRIERYGRRRMVTKDSQEKNSPYHRPLRSRAPRHSPPGVIQHRRETSQATNHAIEGFNVSALASWTPRDESRYPGIFNPDNLCYRNATVHFVMALWPFVGWLKHWHSPSINLAATGHCSLNGIHNCMICRLADIASQYWNHVHAFTNPPQNLIDSINRWWALCTSNPPQFPFMYTLDPDRTPSWTTYLQRWGTPVQHPSGHYEQQDAMDFLRWLLNYIYCNSSPLTPLFPTSQTEHELQTFFTLRLRNTTRCPTPGCPSSPHLGPETPEIHLGLPVALDPPPRAGRPLSLEHCLAAYFSPRSKPRPLDSPLCPSCSSPSSELTAPVVTAWPEILILQLLRFDDRTNTKLETLVDIPEVLNSHFLDAYTYKDPDDDSESDGAPTLTPTYRLQAIISHGMCGPSRDLDERGLGHYKATVRHPRDEGEGDGDGWWFGLEDDTGIRRWRGGVRESFVGEGEDGWRWTPYVLGYVRVREG